MQETSIVFVMGKGNTQEASSRNLPEPHGLCHISEVLDYILSQNSK